MADTIGINHIRTYKGSYLVLVQTATIEAAEA